MKTSLAYSLVRVGTDHVDVYRAARLDPDVPIEETVGDDLGRIEAAVPPGAAAGTRYDERRMAHLDSQR